MPSPRLDLLMVNFNGSLVVDRTYFVDFISRTADDCSGSRPLLSVFLWSISSSFSDDEEDESEFDVEDECDDADDPEEQHDEHEHEWLDVLLDDDDRDDDREQHLDKHSEDGDLERSLEIFL